MVQELRLGDLEMAVLDKVWQFSERHNRSVSVAEVQELLSDRELAYTTIMTVLSNLHKKDLLHREKLGKTFLYRPSQSRQQVSTNLLGRIGSMLFAGSSNSWVSCFLGPDAKLTSAEIADLKSRLQQLEDQND